MALHVVPLKMDNKSLEDYKIIFKKLEGNLECQFELAEVKLTTEDHAQLLSANVNGQVLFIPATSKDDALHQFISVTFIPKMDSPKVCIFINKVTGPMCVTDGHSNETLLTGIRSTYQAISTLDSSILMWFPRVHLDDHYHFYQHNAIINTIYLKIDDKKLFICDSSGNITAAFVSEWCNLHQRFSIQEQ